MNKMKSNVEYSNPKELRKELQLIADSLNLPLNDEKVGLTWTGSGSLSRHKSIKKY